MTDGHAHEDGGNGGSLKPLSQFVRPMLTDMYQVGGCTLQARAFLARPFPQAQRAGLLLPPADSTHNVHHPPPHPQITMVFAYWKQNRHEDFAVFELFFRHTPFKGEFAICAGIDEVGQSNQSRMAVNRRSIPAFTHDTRCHT